MRQNLLLHALLKPEHLLGCDKLIANLRQQNDLSPRRKESIQSEIITITFELLTRFQANVEVTGL